MMRFLQKILKQTSTDKKSDWIFEKVQANFVNSHFLPISHKDQENKRLRSKLEIFK